MSRLNQIAPETATDKAKKLLDAVKAKLGLVPNMTRAMANSPAVLEGYLQLSGALGKGSCRPGSASSSPWRSAGERVRLLPGRPLGHRQDGRADAPTRSATAGWGRRLIRRRTH